MNAGDSKRRPAQAAKDNADDPILARAALIVAKLPALTEIQLDRLAVLLGGGPS